MIRDYNDFAHYKYKLSNEDIFSENLEFGISGIKYDSKTLLVLPRNKSLSPINQYPKLEFVEFNNYDLNESEIGILAENKSTLSKIKYLSFWNTQLPNLKILEYFQNIECLNIAHITDVDFTFDGIDYLEKLKTLCLLKTGKIKDLKEIQIRNEIENFSLIQPTKIKSTEGIENFSGLKYLNIEGSLDTTYKIEKLSGLDNLITLEKIKFHKVNVPFNELMRLKKIPNQIELIIDYNLYPTEQYKELSLELKNVNSTVFVPYIDKGDFIQPIGKGKRIIRQSDKKIEEKKERLISDWNK